ncbi:hypothetical protein TNCT_90291 [Trichonephila clavata]|uniref:Uncharacterized protein n=1 Tax=Trichonephila clavata TaxID=2740835 RepID=A0A8X6M376_TRICU|nr:hypothetical protein TNCT_90291 [Trichonephila clavata]
MHRISSRYHVPKGRPSKRKMQALLKAKKRWTSGEIELEHQSLHVCENDPDASGNVSSNYENNEVNTYPLNSSELNAATERKLSLLSSHTSAEHVISEQNDPTYVLVDTNVWKNLLSTVKCPECDMNNLNIIKTTQLGMASKLELLKAGYKKHNEQKPIVKMIIFTVGTPAEELLEDSDLVAVDNWRNKGRRSHLDYYNSLNNSKENDESPIKVFKGKRLASPEKL